VGFSFSIALSDDWRNRTAVNLGINLVPVFSRKAATHLLCPSGTGQKFTKAQEWGIPVVSNGWLEDIARSGKIASPDAHLVTGPSSVGKVTSEALIDVKGKGKATGVEEDVRMQDITNSAFLVLHSDCSRLLNLADDSPPAFHESPKPQPTSLPEERQSAPGKQSNLQRQATTLIPPDEGPNGFGEPTELLGGSASFSYSAPSRYIDSAKTLSQESPRIRFGTRTSSSVAHTIDGSFFQDLPAAESTTIDQRQKGKEREREVASSDPMDNAEMGGIVPSSQSPSPMKPGPQPLGRRTSSMSPVKVDPLHAKALQESIASLLGKRSSPDGDLDSPMAGPEDDVLPAVGGASRGAKRKKNQRQEEVQQRPKVNWLHLLWPNEHPVDPSSFSLSGQCSYETNGAPYQDVVIDGYCFVGVWIPESVSGWG
jgi:DNA replication regulator DPB11